MSSPSPKAGFASPKGCVALVTGSSGFVGSRLVEMLLERGADCVIGFDVRAPDEVLAERFRNVQEETGGKIILRSQSEGDLTSDAAVDSAFTSAAPKSVDIVYHIAALVGPFHQREMYEEVNVNGTKRIIASCQKHGVTKLVYSSSPSTRFRGESVHGLREDQMEIPEKFVALYAETKAAGEKLVHKACDNDKLLTISVAPHQVYGPYDTLFLPKLLETAGTGKLRIFGKGTNKISVCYVDNYCHGLMCGSDMLYKSSPALAKYYVITDGPYQPFWDMLDVPIKAMGFTSLHKKFHLPVWLLYSVAYVGLAFTLVTGKKFKLTPFTVQMLVIDRCFDITNAKNDLKYEPLKAFDVAWPETTEWFKENWLPKWKKEGSASL